ncbi:MAG: HAMP domain-containing protein [Methyloceanibacter sp.]|uniref:ATP-binding protein n=1 Tax=Methyloceanibacter sp. TaxID=1965321 RepID=UPI001D8F44E2|nr:ATP-binding protein [Methyloceanibacter sp.]MCB1441859.1 HAMP domain-containing protein [Methyloceanibacter sp.]
MLQKLWYDQPVRTQLIVVVAAINFLAALIAGAVSILNTRTATKVEMDASLEVAERFVDVTLKDLGSQGKLDRLDDELPPLLKHLRHVRIMFMSASGQLAIISPNSRASGIARPYAPRWFVALVHPEVVQRKVRLLPDGTHPIIILGEPADEIAEAWQDFSSLALIWLAINAIVLVVLYLVLGRVLDPLASLSKGMHQLEDGEYEARLPPSKVKELAVITGRFNTLASALNVAREENESLYRQLINVQEAERRAIANELHDEAGPCLFGIAANASSIQTTAGQLSGDKATKISSRAGEILSIAERLKAMNRALLKKLRPGPLGQVKLADLIVELTARMQSSHPDTQIHIDVGPLAKSYGETADLTIYRCIQEAITNAIRHGEAKNVSVKLAELSRTNGGSDSGEVRLTVSDDGKGMAPATPKGFGLTTMTERVRSLGGVCTVEKAEPKGVAVRVEIPIKQTKKETAAPARVPELVRERA